ncbi:hypothetical protein ILUMI_09956 [Ignelater luminosus]|uniref:CWH43-like N-terminal domain-containing protein n=1 Tax=Ignelater luminosus TaxID=2038154 RepID=A0A8K0GE24_IGNLU|nr:hypothetical protein ILUMI_09956 [Ignelater luminosus]
MKMFREFKLYYFPSIVVGWLLSACILTYMLALENNHVRPFLPFISECGMTPPESCLFAQFFNIGAVLMAIMGYIRYQQVNIAINSKIISLPIIWNELSLWGANIMGIGISVVGNFQASFSLLIHLTGAVLIFGTAMVYCVIQTKITASYIHIKCNDEKSVISNSRLYYLRIFLTFLYCVACLSTIVLFVKSVEKFDFAENKIHWNKEDTDLKIRTLAAIAEWLALFFLNAYALTMTEDFKSLEFEEIRFKTKYAVFTTNEQNKKRN